MALKDPKVKAQAGQFEQEDGAASTATQTGSPASASTQSAGVEANQAIAKASSNSLAIVKGDIKTLFEDLKDKLPTLEFGTLPRLVGSQGSARDGDKKSVGEVIKIRLVSWNDQFVISPGDDAETSKALVRYSRDGKTIDETGEVVNAYLDELRSKGFPKASCKQYCELIAILIESDKTTSHLNKMVQVSLSPSSRKAFNGYRIQQTVRAQMGLVKVEGQEVFLLKAEVKSRGSDEFTILQPAEAPVEA